MFWLQVCLSYGLGTGGPYLWSGYRRVLPVVWVRVGSPGLEDGLRARSRPISGAGTELRPLWAEDAGEPGLQLAISSRSCRLAFFSFLSRFSSMSARRRNGPPTSGANFTDLKLQWRGGVLNLETPFYTPLV